MQLHWQLLLLLWAAEVSWHTAAALSAQSPLKAPPAVWWHPLGQSRSYRPLAAAAGIESWTASGLQGLRVQHRGWSGCTVWSACLVAEQQPHVHNPTHSLQPCLGSCGSQACAVLHPCKSCMSPAQCGASGYSMKSCRSSYKSGLSVALQLSPPQACRTCATALQRHTALANTLAFVLCRSAEDVCVHVHHMVPCTHPHPDHA